ncbi:cysteine proteinase [Exidia glandulosa HHB12029]|uniref:ubiquitinyl hydrolase 1 n=1 Tax=Exidia glandulosa HHB12029 TaxID=1314781 RepID=A0A165KX51_EXIGL|nr:cysteine proteinase [Exidia glandulosa HHB12029]
MSKKRVVVPQRALEWGWVGTLARDAADITPDMRLRTCGLAAANKWPICPNKFSAPTPTEPLDEGDARGKKRPRLDSDVEPDVEHECSKKACKANPNCLNWLGQEEWVERGGAMGKFMRVNNLGRNPEENKRDPKLPVGLKNLGATCYANALLQLWFQHLAFRDGVYRCRPATDTGVALENSPVFQLQMTFAGLQMGAQKAYDPVRLAECLGLRAAVQQDAQEFAKLFLDLLDKQFKLQEVESLKNLIPDQFEGKRMYANVCSKCHTRSERGDVFHEIVLDLKPNCKLEKQLEDQLRTEDLTGDNRYHCSFCDSLQDAKRYTELHEIPPVLHFTMARFVWDETGDRKKCKDAIQFPVSVDMGRFVTPSTGKSQWYDLRGILLHKGSSAHHGHYESQVLDAASGNWFNFNDDEVEKVDLGVQMKKAAGVENGAKGTKRPARPTVIPDSDDDEIQIVEKPLIPNREGFLSSREAYMLVYARRGEQPVESVDDTMQVDSTASVPIPDPQVEVLKMITEMNTKFADECTAFKQRRQALLVEFKALREAKREVFRAWNISSLSDESVIVSRTALTEWLERGLKPTNAKRKRSGSDATLDGAAATDTDGTVWDGMDVDIDAKAKIKGPPSTVAIDNQDIECWHGRLDPAKAGEMKRITKDAYAKIEQLTGCTFQPLFTKNDVCEDCVETSFLDKYYAQAHPNLVEQFDEVRKQQNVDEPGSVWISKAWLKDWRCKNPKMHRSGVDDPGPDSDDFLSDVKCVHGELGSNAASRCKIPAKAAELLATAFMTWEPVSVDQEECAICEAERSTNIADRKQRQAEAENEKQLLKELLVNEPDIASFPKVADEPHVMVPAAFMRAWYQWLRKPAEHPRPASVDCEALVCQHGQLTVDPNKRGDRSTLRFIREEDYERLLELRDGAGGPKVVVRGVGVSTPYRIESSWDVCDDCRTERLSNYEHGDIVVSILAENEPLPTPEAFELELADSPPPPGPKKQAGTITRYSLRGKPRRSKRKEISITVQRHNLVKTIKTEIFQECKIPSGRQRLFLRGRELDDGSTVSEARILPGDIVELYEIRFDTSSSSTSRKDEGFSGTLLSGGAAKAPVCPPAPSVTDVSSSPIIPYGTVVLEVPSSPLAPPAPSQVACPMCTLLNETTNVTCEVCNAKLPV